MISKPNTLRSGVKSAASLEVKGSFWVGVSERERVQRIHSPDVRHERIDLGVQHRIEIRHDHCDHRKDSVATDDVGKATGPRQHSDSDSAGCTVSSL